MPNINFPVDNINFEPKTVEFFGMPSISAKYYVQLSVTDWYANEYTYIDIIVANKPSIN